MIRFPNRLSHQYPQLMHKARLLGERRQIQLHHVQPVDKAVHPLKLVKHLRQSLWADSAVLLLPSDQATTVPHQICRTLCRQSQIISHPKEAFPA